MFLVLLAALENVEEQRRISDLYEEYGGRLRNAALHVTNNLEIAEDAVEETFVTAVLKKEMVLAMSNEDFLKWGYVVVKNKCIDILRKEKRKANIPDDLAETLADDGIPTDEYVVNMDEYERLLSVQLSVMSNI